jgi:DNA-binding SARP family transcriptional activator
MEFRLLGPLEVRDDGEVVKLGGPKQRALLAYLLLNANRAIALDRLIDALWGERPPPTAAATVQVYVSQLRRLVGRDRLVTRPPGYLLALAPDEIDVARFERLVLRARRAPDPAERAGLLREALALWRGELLADVQFEPFVQAEAERLEEERLTALEERLDAELELGRGVELAAELEQLVTAHPLRERMRGQLMLALYRAGRQAEALALYRATRQMLADELGLDPSPALQRLERRILNHDPELGQPPELRPAPARPDQPAGPHAERKVVTVVVAAVDAAGEDPEDVLALERRLAAPVRRELERFGGTSERIAGAAVAAVFGAPIAHEDDAERAVRAALAARDIQTEGAAAPALRFGIATGSAVAELDPEVAARDGLIIGSTIRSATLLEAAAPAGAVVVDGATRRATSDAIEYRRVRRIEAWEALRERLPVGERRAARRGSQFVGREPELALLHDALASAVGEGSLQLVTLAGAPGIGKTRLVSELREREAASARWLVGRAVAYGDGLPFFALRQIVKALIGVLDSDSADDARVKVDSHMARAVGEDGAWVGAHVRLLLGLESEQTGDRGEAFAAWRRFLEATAEHEPVALLLEDVHWADEGLLDFVEHLAKWATGPLLVLCTARPELLERRPEWVVENLAPLSEAEAGRLLDSVADRKLAPELRQSVLERVGGNPLYVEEYAHALAASGGSMTPGLAIPMSVQGVIAARIDALPLAEKAALQRAAIVGKVFWPGAVAAVSDLDVTAVRERLTALDEKQLVRRSSRSSVGGEKEYVFAHVLVCDVAYEQMPRADRAIGHRRAASWLEALSEQAQDRLELVAYHYSTALDLWRTVGEEPDDLAARTVHALRSAGERAQQLYANTEAAAYFRRALELLEPGEAPELAAGLHEGLGDVLALTGRREDAIAAYEQAQELTPAADRIGAARLHRKTGISQQLERQVEASLGEFAGGDAALGPQPVEPVSGWWEERAEIALARLQLLYFGAPLDEFVAAIEACAPIIDEHATLVQRGRLFIFLGLAALRRDRFVSGEEALGHQQAAVAAAAASGHLATLAWARFNLGLGLLHSTRYSEAEVEFASTLAFAERIGDVTTVTRCLTYLTAVRRRLGDVEGARGYVGRALAAAEGAGMAEYVRQAQGNLSWVAWRDGDLDGAEEHAGAAWSDWDDFWLQRVLAWIPVWPLLGVALRRERTPEAVEYARVLLDSTRQPPPDELRKVLSDAVAAWDAGDAGAATGGLVRAAEVAQRLGYL